MSGLPDNTGELEKIVPYPQHHNVRETRGHGRDQAHPASAPKDRWRCSLTPRPALNRRATLHPYPPRLVRVSGRERSGAIHRRVSVKNGSVVASRRLNERHRIEFDELHFGLNFGCRYATRFCFCGCQTRAKARVYARLPLSRLELPALGGGERSPAIHRRVSTKNQRLVA